MLEETVRGCSFAGIGTVALISIIFGSSSALAAEPGRGKTADFEMNYLKSIINHHYGALRMTELAAGSDTVRDPTLAPREGTSPTPDTEPTQAKAESEALKSLARRNNRMQREEIITAQRFLHDWYGMSHQPRLEEQAQKQIASLEATPPGPRFDHQFMEVLSRHHFMALSPSVHCLVGSELEHHELQRYCSNVVHSQTNDIQDMREMLCKEFQVCDYQPFTGIEGAHSRKD
jgi:uncharacterized protein (DUF305 family)